ncbi:MAG TPA: chromate transporter [Pontiella sp.]
MDKIAPADQYSVRPKLLELFFIFVRISAMTIGGGYVMFPLMKHEVVDSKGWLSDEEMMDYYALGQSVPGVIAMNVAALIGYRKLGVAGAFAAAAGMAAPSLVVILLIAAFLVPYFDHPWVQKAFSGIRASVVALLVFAVWQVGQKSVNSVFKGAVAVGSFLAIVVLEAHPILPLLVGCLVGWVLFKKEPEA